MHQVPQTDTTPFYPRSPYGVTKLAPQPMREDALLTGVLEPTNEPYALAKIAGIKLCESYNRQHGRDYRSVMPTNLYGPGDNFHPEHSHVIPALMRRFHEAAQRGDAEVVVWGSGRRAARVPARGRHGRCQRARDGPAGRAS